MMKVLYISYDGMTDPLGQSQVLPYLVALTKENIQFHLISFEKHDRFLQHKRHIQQICDDAGIVWHPQDYHVEGGIGKTLRQVRRMRKVSIYLQERHNFQLVHCRSYIAALIGLKLKRKFGVKFLFDMRGFWADERVDGKLWDLKNPVFNLIYMYFKKKEISYLKEADFSVVLTENGKEEILSWPAIASSTVNLAVIPCCVDLERFDPLKIKTEDQKALKQSLGITENNFLLGYIGSIGTWYMLNEMLDFFAVMKAQNSQARFLFVTGDDENHIRKETETKGIDPKDIIITSCLHHEMPLHISILDHSIFFIRPSYSKKASSPTKQGEIMAMGIPLTCNAGVGDTDLVVTQYEAGNVIKTFDEKEYKRVISNHSFNRNSTILGAKEFFSLEAGVQKYKAIYQQING